MRSSYAKRQECHRASCKRYSENNRKKLSVVIATHAHQDHISGFATYSDLFSEFDIKDIWLPWTWNPDNEEAVKLQKKHESLTNMLHDHFSALEERSSVILSAEKKAEQMAAYYAILNISNNKKAIELLRSDFGKNDIKPRYLQADDVLHSKEISIPGLEVDILGPPGANAKEFLSRMDPPIGQRYLKLDDNNQVIEENVVLPFKEKWKERTGSTKKILSPEDKQKLQEISDISLTDLAFTLAQARNNESLVTLFKFQGKHLLFAGDAQYGNWRYWLEKDPTLAKEILSHINFFKVPHHGSYNATPKAALEGMNEGHFAAMVSTQSKPWPSIPRNPLMKRLSEVTKGNIVRSDWLSGIPQPLNDSQPTKPSNWPEGFTQGDFWFDYAIEL